jgi:hypothetical protein
MEELWGRAGVCRLTSSALRSVGLQEDTVETLSAIGLPRRVEDIFDCFLCDAPVLRGVDKSPIPGDWFTLGVCGAELVAVEGSTGQVWLLASIGSRARFANSTVMSFVESLAEAQRFVLDHRGASGDRALEDLDALGSAMRSADPRAFDEPTSFWPDLLDDWGLLLQP